MHLFLTSSPCNDNVPEGVNLPCIFFEKNEFVENLRKRMKPDARLVVIAGDPADGPLNDEMTHTFTRCFQYHGLTLSTVALCDERSKGFAESMVRQSDFVLLGGGHVPSQNRFLHEIGLKALLHGYQGVVMGVSAGSMNSASTVYAQPEWPGESIDPEFERFIPGLGLTDVMILPHYQKVWNMMLDGKRLYEDITYKDSYGRRFIAMVDGSYVLVENGGATLYGEGYFLHDGVMKKVCQDGVSLRLN